MKVSTIIFDKPFVELRIEQEVSPFNSFNYPMTLSDDEVNYLSDDEIKTLAYNKVINKAIDGFKEVEYSDESHTFEGFSKIDPKFKSVEIFGQDEIFKITGGDIDSSYSINCIDQYGDSFDDNYVLTLKNAQSGTSIANGVVSITSDDIDTFTVVCSNSVNSIEKIVTVANTDRVLTTEEKLDNLEADTTAKKALEDASNSSLLAMVKMLNDRLKIVEQANGGA